MYIICLVGFVGLVGSNPSKVGRKSGLQRGEFAAAQNASSPNLVQGDIAVPVNQTGADEDVQYAFVTDQKALWMNGIVHYRIEEDEYEGVVEAVFSDNQITNITTALDQIETEVPCIEFRCGDNLLFQFSWKINRN